MDLELDYSENPVDFDKLNFTYIIDRQTFQFFKTLIGMDD